MRIPEELNGNLGKQDSPEKSEQLVTAPMGIGCPMAGPSLENHSQGLLFSILLLLMSTVVLMVDTGSSK